jgi:hypothetical protein
MRPPKYSLHRYRKLEQTIIKNFMLKRNELTSILETSLGISKFGICRHSLMSLVSNSARVSLSSKVITIQQGRKVLTAVPTPTNFESLQNLSLKNYLKM